MELAVKRIEELLENKLQDSDIFFVDVKLLAGNKLQVFLDSDSGLTIDKCQDISRYLEFHIENEKLLPETYNLEVSSPGVGQPLKLFRQYRKNIGRKVEVAMSDESKRTGMLLYVDEEKITLEEEVLPEKGYKGKKREKVQNNIPFTNIKQTKVVITF